MGSGDLEVVEQRATVLQVIEVPRSACTTFGMPCTPNTSLIISTASCGLVVMDVRTDDVPGVDVDHHVGVEIPPLAGPASFVMSHE